MRETTRETEATRERGKPAALVRGVVVRHFFLKTWVAAGCTWRTCHGVCRNTVAAKWCGLPTTRLTAPKENAVHLPRLPRPGAIGPLTARCLGAPVIHPSALTLAAPRLSRGAQSADGGLCQAPQIRHLPHRHHLSLLEFIRQGLGCQVLRDPVCLPASNSDPSAHETFASELTLENSAPRCRAASATYLRKCPPEDCPCVALSTALLHFFAASC